MSIITRTDKLNATINNYALRRGLELTYDSEDQRVMFWDKENDSEWLFSYGVTHQGVLYYAGNVYIPQHIKEELPGTIDGLIKLKEVIDFVSAEIIKH